MDSPLARGMTKGLTRGMTGGNGLLRHPDFSDFIGVPYTNRDIGAPRNDSVDREVSYAQVERTD